MSNGQTSEFGGSVKVRGFRNMKTIILAVIGGLGIGGGGAAGGYATAKASDTPSTIDAKHSAEDVKRYEEDLEFKKQIYDKLSIMDSRLARTETGVEAANTATQRDMAEVKQENRELRANDRLQDREIADLKTRLAVQEATKK